jgi:hypothetical protein
MTKTKATPGADMLLEAVNTVAQRGQVYGPPVVNMQRTAQIWSGILGVEVTAVQVCLCMIGVKMARLVETPDHGDSALDIAGWAACLRDCQQEEG